MPGVGSSGYQTAAQVTALVRACLNDQAGNVFNDAYLAPYLSSAYRKVAAELQNVGQETMITDQHFIVVPGLNGIDPGAQVEVSETNILISQPGNALAFINPALVAPANFIPPDLVEPIELFERPNNNPQSFVPMYDRTASNGLPSQPQGMTLMYWEWREDALNFIGALQDTQVRIRYIKALPDITTTSNLGIRRAVDAVAFITAAMAANAKVKGSGDSWDAAGTDALHDLKNFVARQGQHKGRRRRGYGFRQGSGRTNY